VASTRLRWRFGEASHLRAKAAVP